MSSSPYSYFRGDPALECLPETFIRAMHLRRQEVERNSQHKMQKALSFAGLPILIAVPASLAAIALIPHSPEATMALTAAAATCWAVAAAAICARLVAGRRLKKDQKAVARDPFTYAMKAAGGLGALTPRELLRLVLEKNLESIAWIARELDDASVSETFYSLADEWTGTAEGLVNAARNL